MASTTNDAGGLDLAGLGKLAKAIPPQVYKQATATVISTFEKLVAPITESTEGFGRYIRQKFESMVEVEKAVATYTVQLACKRAAQKVGKVMPPTHPKSFIRAFEEASKETDPLLHGMWTNLLVAQLTGLDAHPHFVQILSHFGPEEARLLTSLRPQDQLGENGGRYIFINLDTVTWWKRYATDRDMNKWVYGCSFLHEVGFADVVAPKGEVNTKTHTLLYRTHTGTQFLKAVSD